MSGKLPKRKVLDLRRHKRANPEESPAQSIPVIASPIYLPQTGSNGAAITASNGYLYVVVGQKLYKVSEKSLKTVQISQLGRTLEQASDSETPKRKHKIVASTEDEPTRHSTTKKRHSSKTD